MDRALPFHDRLRVRLAFGEQAVRIGGGQALVETLLDESQLFELIARVQPPPAFAALGDDQPVAILPTADRRLRQTKHPSDRPDAVDAACASQGT